MDGSSCQAKSKSTPPNLHGLALPHFSVPPALVPIPLIVGGVLSLLKKKIIKKERIGPTQAQTPPRGEGWSEIGGRVTPCKLGVHDSQFADDSRQLWKGVDGGWRGEGFYALAAFSAAAFASFSSIFGSLASISIAAAIFSR